MSKIVKLNDDFRLDLDDFSYLESYRLKLKSYSHEIELSDKQVSELKKILDKEIEEKKAEERASQFRLDPIEFVPCKDCGKSIPISIPQQGWKRSEDARCWACHEKELEEKESNDGCVNCGHSLISCYEKNLCLQCFWALEEEKEEKKGAEVEASGLEDFISKKCITCEKQFWVGAAVNDECLPCQLSEDKEEIKTPEIKCCKCDNTKGDFQVSIAGHAYCEKCIYKYPEDIYMLKIPNEKEDLGISYYRGRDIRPLIEATCQNCLRKFPANQTGPNVFTGNLWCLWCLACRV